MAHFKNDFQAIAESI